jgi:hypothetical protein
VAVRLRRERDPARIASLLELSGSSIRAFYASLVVLLGGGIAAAFAGHLWGRAWIWGSIAILTVVYRVPALRAGTYFFGCDVHPQMNGTFRAG